ncbi:hypothetical protein [Microbacterium sp. bgisy203]|uniref:hypothetical protein n=1 Tax=Microbacterium sp. bgisy203 TaxID=3413799 RepID=UPI003D72EF9B
MRLLRPDIAPAPIPLVRGADVAHASREIERGTLVRVRPGVFADASEWSALAPWNRYLARVHAVALTRPDTVFAFESAAALLGLPIFNDPGTVHELALAGGTARMSAGIRIHTGRNDRSVIIRHGLLLTDVADTCVDLARHRHPAIGLATADAALRLAPSLSRDVLRAINEQRASSRGRARARWALERASAVTESVLESVSVAVFEWLGMPEPDLQVSFRSEDGSTDRPDFTWRLPGGRRVGADADGDLKYDGRYGTARDVMHRQTQRDARLRRHLDAIGHFGWNDVLAVDPLRGILREIGLRPAAPEHAAPLLTLRRALSPSTRSTGSPRETASVGRDIGL